MRRVNRHMGRDPLFAFVISRDVKTETWRQRWRSRSKQSEQLLSLLIVSSLCFYRQIDVSVNWSQMLSVKKGLGLWDGSSNHHSSECSDSAHVSAWRPRLQERRKTSSNEPVREQSDVWFSSSSSMCLHPDPDPFKPLLVKPTTCLLGEWDNFYKVGRLTLECFVSAGASMMLPELPAKTINTPLLISITSLSDKTFHSLNVTANWTDPLQTDRCLLKFFRSTRIQMLWTNMIIIPTAWSSRAESPLTCCWHDAMEMWCIHCVTM